MNPLTNMKNVIKLSEQELHTNNKTSWHDQYRDSAWVFIGGLPYDLSEGDIICIFSQYGEIVNINLIRDKDTGKSKGFCFLCYEDQRSTILAVDNFNGIKILNRIIRVDHVNNYKIPKQGKKTDAETKKLYEEGCAPEARVSSFENPIVKTELLDVRETLADQIEADIKLPQRLPIYPIKTEPVSDADNKADEKTHKKKKKKRNKHSDDHSSSDSDRSKSKKKRSKHSKIQRSDVHNSHRSEYNDCKSSKFDYSDKQKKTYSNRNRSSSEEYIQDKRRDKYARKKNYERRSRSRSKDRGRNLDKLKNRDRRLI